MKKQLAVFISILCGFCGSFNTAYSNTASGFSCVAPYDLSSSFSSTLSRYTGINFLGSKVAEQVLKSQITKNADGKFNVAVKSYSANDLKSGRFKSMEIHGKNVVADGVHFSSMDIQTLCDFNYIVYDEKKSTAFFKEDFPLSFAVTLSEEDLNNTMKDAGYFDLIEKVNGFGKALSLFEVESTQAKIRNNRFVYVFNLNVPALNFFGVSKNSKFSVALMTNLLVDEGEIILDNPQFVNSSMKVDLGSLTKVFNYLNPLEYSLKVMENKDAVLNVRNVNIVNDKINITGIINVPKDVLTQL